MELKLDKTTKILLGAIALGLFLNVVPVANAEWGDSYSDGAGLKNIASALEGIAAALRRNL